MIPLDIKHAIFTYIKIGLLRDFCQKIGGVGSKLSRIIIVGLIPWIGLLCPPPLPYIAKTSGDNNGGTICTCYSILAQTIYAWEDY